MMSAKELDSSHLSLGSVTVEGLHMGPSPQALAGEKQGFLECYSSQQM